MGDNSEDNLGLQKFKSTSNFNSYNLMKAHQSLKENIPGTEEIPQNGLYNKKLEEKSSELGKLKGKLKKL